MLKTMIFVDGSWFDAAVKEVCLQRRPPRRILIEHVDFRSIQHAIGVRIRDVLGFDVDFVRTYCAAGHPDPDTVGPDSKENALRIAAGWDAFGRFPCTVVDVYPYSYGGREFPNAEIKSDKTAANGETKTDRPAVSGEARTDSDQREVRRRRACDEDALLRRNPRGLRCRRPDQRGPRL
jgi:hypothetical protein